MCTGKQLYWSLAESDTPSLVPCSLQDQRHDLAPAVATWRQWQVHQASFLAKKRMALLQQQVALQTKQAEVCILCSCTHSPQPLLRRCPDQCCPLYATLHCP